MGQFDYLVNNVIARISAARSEKKQEATSLSTTAENMFGGVGQMIQELQSALDKKFPDQKPSVSLGGWTKIPNGAANNLKLKSATAEKDKDIKLEIELGRADVMIDRRIVASETALKVLADETADFFIAE
jgi:hypothetical protein